MDCQRLKQLVAASNENQKEIAEKLSISQQRFNFYVTGKREPDGEMLLRIADYFGTSTDYLLGRDDTKKELPAQGGEPIGPNKRALLDLVDNMSEDEMAAILELVKAAKKMRDTTQKGREKNAPD